MSPAVLMQPARKHSRPETSIKLSPFAGCTRMVRRDSSACSPKLASLVRRLAIGGWFLMF